MPKESLSEIWNLYFWLTYCKINHAKIQITKMDIKKGEIHKQQVQKLHTTIGIDLKKNLGKKFWSNQNQHPSEVQYGKLNWKKRLVFQYVFLNSWNKTIFFLIQSGFYWKKKRQFLFLKKAESIKQMMIIPISMSYGFLLCWSNFLPKPLLKKNIKKQTPAKATLITIFSPLLHFEYESNAKRIPAIK